MNTSKRLRLYFVLLLIALLTMGTLYEYSRQKANAEPTTSILRDYTEIAQEGRLRVLTGYSMADSTLSEESYNKIRQLNTRSGLHIELRLEDDNTKALELLDRGEVDLVLLPILRSGGIDSTRFAWIDEQISGPLFLAQRRDSLRLERQLELGGKTITLPRDNWLRLFVRHLSEEIGDSIYIAEDPLYNTEQLLLRVKAGEIDYTLCPASKAKHYSKLFPELDISLPVSYALRRGWLVRRSSHALADSLTKWLEDPKD